jgi:hypothetical protein
MDVSQTLSQIAIIVGLLGTSIGLIKSVYEIRKLKEEVKKLKRSEGEAKIYLPTLEDLVSLSLADSEQYLVWLARKQKRRKRDRGPRSYDPFVDLLEIFNVAKSVHLPIAEGARIPRQLIDRIQKWGIALAIFGGATIALVGFFLMDPVGHWLGIPNDWSSNLFLLGVGMLLGWLLTRIFLLIITRILNVDYNWRLFKKAKSIEKRYPS